MFTKKDFKTGDITIRRNGQKFIAYIDMDFNTKSGFASDESWHNLNEIDGDLYFKNKNELDIIKIYRPNDLYQLIGNSYDSSELIFERPDETIMTIKEIEEKLGIKNLKIVK